MINLNKKSQNEPLIRIAKRGDNVWWKSILINVIGIAVAILLGIICVALIGKNPGQFIAGVLNNTFSKSIYVVNFLGYFTPLLVISIGISFAFKMKFWNIGAEGQFLIGALVATTTAIAIGNSLVPAVTLPLVVLTGTLAAGIYGAFVAVLKVQWGTNETLMTLMLNYVALYLVKYFTNVKYFKGSSPFPIYQQLPKDAHMFNFPVGNEVADITIFIAIILVFLSFIYNRYSKHGYEISLVGDSINTAKYAGVNVKKVVIRTMFLSSAVIGLAGAMQVTSSVTSFSMSESITYGLGWTGIIVAWLAKLNPIGITAVSLFIAILEQGCPATATQLGMSKEFTDVLIGIILFTVLAFDFFVNYKVVIRKSNKKQNNADDGNSNNNGTKVSRDEQAKIVDDNAYKTLGELKNLELNSNIGESSAKIVQQGGND